jgi:hypothetical protein
VAIVTIFSNGAIGAITIGVLQLSLMAKMAPLVTIGSIGYKWRS